MRQANVSPPLLSFLFVHSEVKQLLGPYCCFFVLQADFQYRLAAYKSHKPCSHLGLLSLSSWKRETTHERVEITSSSWPLTVVTCNHFHISATELRHFLYAFYLWASKNANQSIPRNKSDPCFAERCQDKLQTLFPLKMARIQEYFFPTLFSPHRLCPLQSLTCQRL